MAKAKTVFFCTDCGNEYPKWMGQCPACGSWNTIVEQTAQMSSSKSARAGIKRLPSRLTELAVTDEIRFGTGLSELDRVLGGGAVKGSLVLVGGAPGIGKSTLVLQMCGYIGRERKILYVTGEESEHQLKMRADRLGVTSRDIFILTETNIEDILEAVDNAKPDVLVLDSIQTLFSPELTSPPGSVGQVKECTVKMMQLAKSTGTTVFVIGHVNKEGAIAGPKVLEHMVDCVLYFEGDSFASYRILRAAKNRFGSTNEIGVFEMQDTGLAEVPNPSGMLLAGRPANSPGTCVTCVMEGSRPILAEVQALVTPSSFNVPRRNSNGVDYARAMMLLAVLEKRTGLKTGGCDSYINVIGGLSLEEPAADLATVLAIASSFLDRALPDDLVAMGEVGLTGELRSISQMEQRLSESLRLGFKTCVIPVQRRKKIHIPEGLEVIEAATVGQAINKLM